MSEITSLLDDLKISVKGIEKVLEDINNTLSKSTQQVSTFTQKVQEIEKIAKVTGAVEEIGESFSKAIQPGEAFNQTLKDIQDSTFLTTDEMKLIDQASRDLAKSFGIDAADGAKGFKEILTELAPELIKAPDALKAMGENAAVLSKQMGNDPVAASRLLITAMKEYGVSMENPTQAAQKMTEMMNIMSAASNKSKETLSGIQAAIGEVGSKAYASGISFSELNAAIVLIEKNGIKGANAGKAIDEVLTSMASSASLSKEAQNVIQKYNVDLSAAADTSKSLEERLAVFGPLVNDQATMIEIFGKANVQSASEMILCRDELTKNALAITNTNDAYDQAKDKLSTLSGWMDKTNSWAKELSFRFNEMITPIKPLTSAVGSLLSGFSETVSVLSNVSTIMDSKVGTSLKSAASSTKDFLLAIGGSVKDKISQLPTAFNSAVAAAKDFLQPLSSIKDKIGETAIKALELGKMLKNNLAEGFKHAAIATWDQIKATIAHVVNTGRAIIAVGILKVANLLSIPVITATGIATWAWATAFGVIIIAVVAVIGAVVLMVKYWDVIVEKFNAIKEWFLASNIFGGLLDQFPWLQDAIDAVWAYISPIVDMIKSAFEGIGNAFGAVADFFTGDSKSTSKESQGKVAPKKGTGNLFENTENAPAAVGNNTHLPGSKNLTQNAKAITSGGGSAGNTYNIRMEKLQDQTVLNVPNVNQSMQELERVFGEMMKKFLNSINTSQV